MPYQTLQLEEAADYLHLTVEQLAGLVRERRVPFLGSSSKPSFRRRDLDRWAQCRILGLGDMDLRRYHHNATLKQLDLSPGHALIPELCRPAWCVPALDSRTIPSLLRNMTELADQTERLISRADLQASLEARERLGTTALPGGFALLHTEHQDPYLFSESFMVIAHVMHPLPFHAPDGHTTDLFFLLCCQDDHSHLHVLARICLMCQQTPLIYSLRAAETAVAMYDALASAEQLILQSLDTERCMIQSASRGQGAHGYLDMERKR